MSWRYVSVDRAKEIKAKREIIPPFSRKNLDLNNSSFDINNILYNPKPKALRALNTNRCNHKKFSLINKQITRSYFCDINTKKGDLSAEVNNYFKLVINSNLSKRKTMNNSYLFSGKKTLKPKINIRNCIKEEIIKKNYPPILKSERLYPKMNKDNNSINILKTIKAIRNNNLILKRNNNPLFTLKMNSNNDNIAYKSQYENIVFDANKLLNSLIN